MSVANFLESISRRRSIYNIGKNVNISKDEIVKVIEDDPCCQFRTVKLGRF